MKETQTPIPWQVAKNKIEFYTTAKWKQKWITTPHYKHTKLFYDSPFPILHGAATVETGTQRLIQDALAFVPFN